MLNLNDINFSNPSLKNATHTLDTRVLEAIEKQYEALKDKGIKTSKSDVVNKILLSVFNI